MTEASDKQAGKKRLIIDLAKCDSCEGCCVGCFLDDGVSRGAMLGLREMVTFMLLCRRCKLASCVLACPFDALERQHDGTIKRHNLRCVSCKSCAHACPFGTIYSELLTFYDMPYETTCADCMAGMDSAPACVAGCRHGALEYCVPDPAEADVYIIDEYLAARVRRWIRNEPGDDAEGPGMGHMNERGFDPEEFEEALS